jgi:hypothetical protein
MTERANRPTRCTDGMPVQPSHGDLARPVAPGANLNTVSVGRPLRGHITVRKLDRRQHKRDHGTEWAMGAVRPGAVDPERMAGLGAGPVAGAMAGANALRGAEATPATTHAAAGAVLGAVF